MVYQFISLPVDIIVTVAVALVGSSGVSDIDATTNGFGDVWVGVDVGSDANTDNDGSGDADDVLTTKFTQTCWPTCKKFADIYPDSGALQFYKYSLTDFN